jgi:alpha-amylase
LIKRSVVILVLLSAASAALAGPPDRPILQYFETTWNNMRYRMPDVFMAGYGAVWLPPPCKGQGGTSSIGYDLFDRFDLGSSSAPTRYGTETDFRQLIEAYHRANVEVYVDWIMNHNGTKDKTTTGFLTQGGYPGFVLQITGSDADGDFHAYTSGCPQSTNPSDPCYDLYQGRLVGLIDIAQEKNHNYIRNPVVAGDPNDIPAGTIYNKPDPKNARLYPDMALTPTSVTNPGTTRNPGTTSATLYPFNETDPLEGDAIVENATGLLCRATRWMLEDVGVDGFRLDAAKHTPTWFWDTYWDTAVYLRHRTFDGTLATPYSFCEVVEGGGASIQDWIRKPAGEYGNPGQGWPASGWAFGNRDALDLNEAGALRDLVSADGSGSWGNAMGASVDTRDDGYQNGTMGVHHVDSHDNTIEDAENDTVVYAYVLARTGTPCVYHNALQWGAQPNNFPRANGRDDAIGTDDDFITRMVQIRNCYGRGWFMPINATDPVNPSTDDVLVFTRRTPNGPDNLLIALNDKENAGGVETRNVATTFPSGTRLWELTGNATDPAVDPSNQIPNVLGVDAAGRLYDANNPSSLYLKIPSNKNAGGVLHGRGYVVYGPAVPSGTLSVTNVAQTIPADSSSVAAYARRLTPIDVIASDSFEIRLQTTQTDALDPNTDDRAVFRIDSGFTDYNGNGSVDNPAGFEAGFENFLTQSSPLYGGGTGLYRQTIDATELVEGYHYITVWAYRHRASGDPLLKEFRKVIYLDRVAPQVTLVQPTQTGDGDITSSPIQVIVQAADPTVTEVHVFLDQHVNSPFITWAEQGQGLATRDGSTFIRSIPGVIKGNHRIDVVAFDEMGGVGVSHHVGINATTVSFYGGLGDVNNDFAINGRDIASFIQYVVGQTAFHAAADFNGDGLNDANDVPAFVAELLNG